MLKDINTTYDEGLYVSTEVYEFAQEIRNIFSLQKHSIPSDVEAGLSNVKQLLFVRSINKNQIIEIIDNEITTKTYWASKYRHSVEVNFIKGSIRDIIHISVYVINTDGTKTAKQTFVFK